MLKNSSNNPLSVVSLFLAYTRIKSNVIIPSEKYESSNNKKSLLNIARRRTAEVQLGPDGKFITNQK